MEAFWHIDKEDLCPEYFATTVYILLPVFLLQLQKEGCIINNVWYEENLREKTVPEKRKQKDA